MRLWPGNEAKVSHANMVKFELFHWGGRNKGVLLVRVIESDDCMSSNSLAGYYKSNFHSGQESIQFHVNY